MSPPLHHYLLLLLFNNNKKKSYDQSYEGKEKSESFVKFIKAALRTVLNAKLMPAVSLTFLNPNNPCARLTEELA